MKVMVLIKASASTEAGELPSQELLTEMGNYNEELVKAGIILAGEGLHPSSKGARVIFSGQQRQVMDGPFTETKELVAGFWLWKVDSLEHAIEWVKRCPNPTGEESTIEIRPIYEAEDFGESFTPELREQESTYRAIGLGLQSPTFQNRNEMTVAGLNQAYNLETRDTIPAQWERFVEHIGKVPGQIGQDSYGVTWKRNSEGAFNYLTCVEVADTAILPEGFEHLTILASRYAVFPHVEHFSQIDKAFETIYTQWAADSGLKLADTPCFERYTSDFNPETGTGGIELWVPLETAS